MKMEPHKVYVASDGLPLNEEQLHIMELLNRGYAPSNNIAKLPVKRKRAYEDLIARSIIRQDSDSFVYVNDDCSRVAELDLKKFRLLAKEAGLKNWRDHVQKVRITSRAADPNRDLENVIIDFLLHVSGPHRV